MSIRTKPELEKHCLYLASGVTGLGLLLDYGEVGPEFKTFVKYLKETPEYNFRDSQYASKIPKLRWWVSTLPKIIEERMNELLSSIKASIDVTNKEEIKKAKTLTDELYKLMSESEVLFR